ncbi:MULTISPECIES: response regulator [Mesonia]|uniref:Response regulator rcp1 n=1 Tax=Mesonia oceanica TaxID=2687242 RepID=A0AC61Y604_9FLAO|nr:MULTISPECIES: response regulator [Mesonia]MAN27720.1 response regulator [Mesonia sp.]MAQ39677.1 response regulator [Mesonia sp.]VVU99562.1 Response regulator rcp1 [Mesonia oceanica]|tara:strand:- start:21155 stop:21568 length:414 start_codon:yes stop_codon:yes gene_type:complete
MKHKLRILLIEDDMIEVMKVNRTISSLKLPHEVIEVGNGEEALDYLKSENAYPDIILLDLNMPKMNGVEFLNILRNDEVLRYLPTIILTTSSNQKDILECYKAGVAGYMVKPLKYEDYVKKLTYLLEYWSVNELIKG